MIGLTHIRMGKDWVSLIFRFFLICFVNVLFGTTVQADVIAKFKPIVFAEDTSVNFLNQSSGNAHYYHWDFGDGEKRTDISKNTFTHHYSSPGDYEVVLVIVDTLCSVTSPNTCVDTFKLLVSIPFAHGVAAANTIISLKGNSIIVKNTSKGHYNKAMVNMGDKTYYDIKDSILHEFASPGIYDVTLKIYNDTSGFIDEDVTKVVIKEEEINLAAYFSFQVIDSILNTVQFNNESIGLNSIYSWRFGDGEFSYQKQPIHDFKVPGIYKVSLAIMDTVTKEIDNYEKMIKVNHTQLHLESDFLYFCENDLIKVYFNDKSVSKKEIIKHTWNFGDGVESNEKNPSHIYSKPGIYEVCILTESIDDHVNISCQKIIVGQVDNLPIASTWYFQHEDEKDKIYFQNHSFGEPTVYKWNFGDEQVSNFSKPVHQYQKQDLYQVSLELEDPVFSSDYVMVDLRPVRELSAKFFVVQQNKRLKSSGEGDVIFKGSISGDVTYLEWDFGNGETSNTTFQPVHNYNNTRLQYVCFTAGNEYTGEETTYCDTVEILLSTTFEQETSKIKELNIYPNPFSDILNIQLPAGNDEIKISLLDLSGKLIEQVFNGIPNEETFQYFPVNLKSGMYLLKIDDNKHVVFKKIIFTD